MKRIFSFLFAIIALVGTTSIFTACQEDAPEINYTINITVNNDFTEVVNAINNGTMKQEAAIAALTAAINQMNGDQTAKLQALIEAINTLATTLDAKLAIIEAAIKAQTLSLENKLALLEAAIKGMPDYSDKLAAIETAIKNIPDYSEKMAAIEAAIKNAPDYTAALEEIKKAIAALPDYTEKLGAIITAIEALPDYSKQLEAIAAAVEAIPDYSEKFEAIQVALEAIAENIEAQEGQYADELAALTESIDAIKSEVEDGNKSQEDALAEIIALLESGALAGGGSGSGSGGEGEGTTPSITFKTDLLTNINVSVKPCKIETEEGVELRDGYPNTSGSMGYTHYGYKRMSNENPIKLTFDGNPIDIELYNNEITEIDLSQLTALEKINLGINKLTKVDFSHNKNLKKISLFNNQITGENMTALVESLPDRTGKEVGKLYLKNCAEDDKSAILLSDIAIAEGKNWEVLYNSSVKIESGSITFTTSKSVDDETYFTVRATDEITSIEGAKDINVSYSSTGKSKYYTFKLTSQTVKINGVIDRFEATFEDITSLDVTKMYSLSTLDCTANKIVTLAIDKEKNIRLNYAACGQNLIEGGNMTALVESLPDRKHHSQGYIVVSTDPNKMTDDQKAIGVAKNWEVH